MSNEDVKNSSSVYNSRYVYNSRSVDNSSYVDNSRSVRFLCKAMFCYDIGFKEYVVFNKEVGKERFQEVYNKITSIMNPNLQMKTEIFEDEWKKNVTTEQWKELAQIPEFDRKVVESIVGFTLPLEDETKEDVKEMTVKEVEELVGKKVKIIK